MIQKKNGQTGLFLVCLLMLPHSVFAAIDPIKVNLTWQYEKFPLKMRVFAVRPEKEFFVSETGNVKTIAASPAVAEIKGSIEVPPKSSRSLVLIVENKTKTDQYFFAVPHELNPHHASTGHYFECLCIGRLFKVPANSVWYRIVRVNLDEAFQNVKTFKIDHKVIGVSQKEAQAKYQDRIYE